MRNTWIRILTITLIASLLFSITTIGLTGCSKKQENNVQQSESRERSTYNISKNGFGYYKFTNKVDGYSIKIPKKMTVDMSMSGVRAVLENKGERIEIYRQELNPSAGITAESYSNYSNLFLQNSVDHKLEYQDKIKLGKYEISVAQWSRMPLKYMKNDRPYYASVDVFVSDSECFTFLFKSKSPYGKTGKEKDYLNIINSLKLEEKTEKLYNRKIKQVENKSWNEKTAKTYRQYFGENATLKWGIFDKQAPLDFKNLNETESKLDYRFPILLYYTGFIEGAQKHPRLETALKNAKENNRLLELTLQTLNQDPNKGNMIYDVLNGKYDTYLQNYVADVKAYGEPVLFRVGNEMNGDWCVYSAYHTAKDTEIYKAFYKHIYQLFKEAGANNVIWIWNPNAKSFPDFKWNDELCYFPGDNYVDVIGLTNYNTGTYYEGEQWTEFADLYDSLYSEYQKKYEKPFMITEFASSSVGGDKAEWVSKMFQHIKKYNLLKVAIWWSSCDFDTEGNISRPYFIDESSEITNVFKKNLENYK